MCSPLWIWSCCSNSKSSSAFPLLLGPRPFMAFSIPASWLHPRSWPSQTWHFFLLPRVFVYHFCFLEYSHHALHLYSDITCSERFSLLPQIILGSSIGPAPCAFLSRHLLYLECCNVRLCGYDCLSH